MATLQDKVRGYTSVDVTAAVLLPAQILKSHFGMVSPDVEIDDGKGTILISSEEGETEGRFNNHRSHSNPHGVIVIHCGIIVIHHEVIVIYGVIVIHHGVIVIYHRVIVIHHEVIVMYGVIVIHHEVIVIYGVLVIHHGVIVIHYHHEVIVI